MRAGDPQPSVRLVLCGQSDSHGLQPEPRQRRSVLPPNSTDGLAISSLPAPTKVPKENIAFKQIETKHVSVAFGSSG